MGCNSVPWRTSSLPSEHPQVAPHEPSLKAELMEWTAPQELAYRQQTCTVSVNSRRCCWACDGEPGLWSTCTTIPAVTARAWGRALITASACAGLFKQSPIPLFHKGLAVALVGANGSRSVVATYGSRVGDHGHALEGTKDRILVGKQVSNQPIRMLLFHAELPTATRPAWLRRLRDQGNGDPKSTSLEINTKRLLIHLIVVVLVYHNLGHKTSSAISLNQIPQIILGLNSLLEEHHLVYSGLQTRDDISNGARKVEDNCLDGFKAVKLTSLKELEVEMDRLLKLASQLIKLANALAVLLVSFTCLPLHTLARGLARVRVVENFPVGEVLADCSNGRFGAFRSGGGKRESAVDGFLFGDTSHCESLGLPLVKHLGAVGKCAAHIANESQETVVNKILTNTLGISDVDVAHATLQIFDNIGTRRSVEIRSQNWHLSLAHLDAGEHLGNNLLDLFGLISIVANFIKFLFFGLLFLVWLDLDFRDVLTSFGAGFGVLESQFILLLEILH
ncbi:hypothetical protein HG531_004390 [Fusarium graminearum]|nr:hypothetical protein HG531_004390 [Fusarium graminearum]